MAVNAVFTADFSAFHSQVETATAKLRGFEVGTKDVGGALDRMAAGMTTAGKTSADSARLIAGMSAAGTDAAKATGAAALATSGFGGALKAVGPLLGAFGISLGVGAVVSFGKNLVGAADALVKLKDKTDIGFQGLQKLQIAGDDAGNSLEQLTGAVTNMQNRLAGGDASAVGAIGKLNLSLAYLKGLAPDQQFMAIADAIRAVKDPAEQVNIAMDIFGRSGAEILPTLKRGFDDLRDASVGMSDETVKNLDALGDAWASMWRAFKGGSADMVVGLLSGLKKGLAEANLPEAAMNQRGLAEAFKFSAEELATLHAPQATYITNTNAATLSTGEQASIEKVLASQHSVLAESHRKVTEANKDAAAAAKKAGEEAIDQWETQQANQNEVLKYWPKLDLAILNTDKTFGLLRGTTDSTGSALYEFGLLGQTSISRVGVAATITNEEFRKLADEAQTLGEKIAGGLSNALSGLNDIFQSAFEGGGGVTGALKSFGTDMIQNGLKLIPVVGEFVSQFAGAITAGLSKLFGGVSKEVQEARDEQDKMVESLRDIATQGQITEGALTDDYHTIAIVGRDAFLKLGLSAEETDEKIKLLLGTDDPKAFAQAMADVEAAIASNQAAVERLDAAVDKYGLTWKELDDPTARLAAFETDLEELADTFVSLTSAGYETDAVLEQMGDDLIASLRAAKDGGVLDDFLAKLVSMGTISEEVAAKLMGMGESVDYEALTDKAETYGIKLADLGPQFQQANISGTAKTIFDDFTDLIEAGGDVNGVMAGMSDEVSNLLIDAREFGAAIPVAMKPMIEQFLEAGRLTDENGEKIKDLTGITFADSPLEKGLKDLTTVIGDLVEVLGGVPGKLADIGKTPVTPIRIPVGYDYEAFNPDRGGNSQDNYASMGGRVTADGVQYFARGGPVLAWPKARGMDTVPIMARPGETIRTPEQEAALGENSQLVAAIAALRADLLDVLPSRLAKSNAIALVKAGFRR